MVPASRTTFLRDAAVTTLVLAILRYAAPYAGLRALQIPGYLLVVGFDMLEGVFGPVRSSFDLVFALYLVALGVLGAVLAHGFRMVASKTSLPAWRVGIAAGLSIIAAISFLFAAVVYSGTTQSEPVRILVATGIVLVVLAALFADVLGITERLSARGPS